MKMIDTDECCVENL